MKLYVNMPTDATQLVRLGTKNVHEEHDCQGFVCCSNAFAKRFLNYICSKHFIQLEPIYPFGHNVYNCIHQLNWECIASEKSLLNSDMLSTIVHTKVCANR